MINIVSQSTSERHEETKALYDECKPYLDKGYSLRKAVMIVSDRRVSNTKNGWFRDLRDYAESQGYEYNKRRWSRGR